MALPLSCPPMLSRINNCYRISKSHRVLKRLFTSQLFSAPRSHMLKPLLKPVLHPANHPNVNYPSGLVLIGRYRESHLTKWGVPPGWGLDLGHLGKGLSSFYRSSQTGELSKQYRVAASGGNEALEQFQIPPQCFPIRLTIIWSS